MEILTKRPKKMSFEDYKEHLKRQNLWLKNRLNGFLVYKSWEAVKVPVGEGKSSDMIRTYKPFVGSVKHLKPL